MKSKRSVGAMPSVTMAFALLSFSFAWGDDQSPEIGHVFPDFPINSPCIITGENFFVGQTQVLCWSPPDIKDPHELLNAVEDNEIPFPETPPGNAQRMEVLDTENQILVARIAPGVAWVKTTVGTSSPHAVDLPRPCWMNPTKVQAGKAVFMFGFALRAPYRETTIALRAHGKTIAAKVINEPRGYRDVGPTVYFEIPRDLDPGRYTVFCHNGNGGAIGWRSAGTIETTSHSVAEERLFSIADFGAKGDDEANDFDAIAKAFATASAAKSKSVQPVVYFPAGKWRTDTTLVIPSGVWVRGASRDLTVIEGFGDARPNEHPTTVIRPSDHTRMEEVTVKGITWKGPQDYWPAVVCGTKISEDVEVQSIRVYAGDYRSSQLTFPYWAGGISIVGKFVKLLDSDIYGNCNIGGYRAECIGNKIHGGGSRDSVSFSAPDCVESVIDCNHLVDAPTRFMVSATRHCLIRFNEVHPNHRGTYSNSEESFLSHGATPKEFGHPTSADAAQLMDQSRHWKPHSMQNQVVVITSGRGMGQFRYVTDNSENSLHVDRDWRIIPDATSEYVVGDVFAENIWYGNLNLTPGRASLWRDQIGNFVSHHRDAFGGGIDIVAADRTDAAQQSNPAANPQTDHGFFPAWYNVIDNCWLDGSRITLGTTNSPNSLLKGPQSFGNLIVRNKVRQAHAFRTGFDWNAHLDAAISVGNRPGTAAGGPASTGNGAAKIAISHTIVADNFVSYTNRGISVPETARKTFLLSNEFEAVETPILDWSSTTIRRANMKYELDQKGERRSPISDRAIR